MTDVPDPKPAEMQPPLPSRRKPSNFRGPKSCLDEFKQREICAVLAMGCTVRTAAEYVECAEQTIYRRARTSPAFRAALRKSRAQSEISLLRLVQEAAAKKGQWRAAAWLLSRYHADRYQSHKPTELTPQQLALVLNRFAEVLIVEISNAPERRRIAQRLQALTSTLEVDAAAAAQWERPR